MLLASFLRFFENAELEHAAWILLGSNRPLPGTVLEEPLEV